MSPYLRETILQRKLDKHINLGRIWRILGESGEPPKPRMLSKFSNDELVEVLGHNNGWYRDMAQRLLVERRSPEAIHNLQQLIHKSPNYLARLHALWTLEGMEVEEPGIYLTALKDQKVPVQVASMRILEKIAIKNPKVLRRLEEAIATLASNETVALQMALTSGIMQAQVKQAILLQILATYMESPLFRDAVMSSIPNQEYQFLSVIMDQSDWLQYSSDKEIMLETLTAAIVKKRDSEELKKLLALVDLESPGWAHRAIIAGLSIHDTPTDSDKILLETAPGIFSQTFDDHELNSRISRVSTLFTWPGNEVKSDVRVANQDYLVSPKIFAQGRSLYLTICSNCHGIDGKGLPRFAPPLVRSEWVLGDPKRLVLILLHGMEGPIEVNGKKYDAPDILPVMPSFASTSAEDLAAVMTYVRQEWGHDASPIDAGTVGTIRVGSQGKVIPWRVEELLGIESEQ
jgi:mono/diheme cytochrome c family protein